MRTQKKMIVSLSADTYRRWTSAIPAGQRSERIASLIEAELDREEEALYQVGLKLEKCKALNKEMKEWEMAFGQDGLEDLEYEVAPKVKRQG